jgi:hypothetical protein
LTETSRLTTAIILSSVDVVELVDGSATHFGKCAFWSQ